MKTQTLFLLFTFCISNLFAQSAINRIYSDFGGWWSTSSTAFSPISPNNNHNLIGFSVNGHVYSTGVNDDLLINRNIIFTPQIFKGLPMTSTGSGGIIGMGSAIPENQVVNNPALYLTDGIQGLNLGTAIFNVTGTNVYTITDIEEQAIGDGIPDIIIPQLGDVSGTDIFKFLDEHNQIVGVSKGINFSVVAPVGNANWKFYTRTNPPRVGAAGAGNRVIRMVAYDFADFGITTSNYTRIKYFVHQLSGTSDQAFIAYNASSFILLPIELNSFDVVKNNNSADILWSTTSELNNDYFTIERSADAVNWSSIGSVLSKAELGVSNDLLDYSFTDNMPLVGDNYYRLKQTDFEGSESYSLIKNVYFESRENKLIIFPNPAIDVFQIQGLENSNAITLRNIQGQIVLSLQSDNIYTEQIHIGNLPSGVYILSIVNEAGLSYTSQIIKQ